MEIVSYCPLRVGSLRWQATRWRWMLTVVAKATYRLGPTTCSFAEEQIAVHEREQPWDDDARRSVRAPSDLVPYKPQPEVTLVGSAFAPQGEPAARLVARLLVGNVDKSITVHGDRAFESDGALRAVPRFQRMPLRYERAAGGPDTRNPVGVARGTDALGVRPLPNLEPPGLNITRPEESIEPIGFAPIAIDWPARRERLARAWSPESLATEPVPEWLDQRFFMSAPPDQYLEELRPDERIVLENLHPEHPRLATSLPGLEPRAFIERPRFPVAELPMACDTLWIDTDLGLCTMTWRAYFALEDPDQEGRVLVAMEQRGRALGWADVARLAPSRSDFETTKVHTSQPPVFSGVPFRPDFRAPLSKPPVSERLPVSSPASKRSTGTLDAPIGDELRGAINSALAHRGEAPLAVPSSPIPWASGAQIPAPEPPALAGLNAPLARPSLLPTPAPLGLDPAFVAPAPVGSFAPPVSVTSSVPPPLTIGQQAAANLVEPSGITRSPAFDLAAPAHDAARSPSSGRPAPAGDVRGALAASNAAAAANTADTSPAEGRAGGARPAAPPRELPREHVDLLGYDPAALPRILADKAFAAMSPPRPATWVAGEAVAREPAEARARRALLAVLSRGAALDEAELARTASAAYQPDGTFTAPLALVAGELVFSFDELETLRATLSVIAPFAANDKKLKDAMTAGAEVLKSEWSVTADVAEGATRRVEEAFGQGQRAVAASYLESSVEKLLLEGRRYQKKKSLFGATRIRTLFSFGAGGASIPAYLPEAMAEVLPLFRRLKVKMIVEVRAQEDQYETHADALLVLALGRVLKRTA